MTRLASTIPGRLRGCLWLAPIVAGLAGAAGCSAKAGMFCQQQSDCRTGLICRKPAADSGTSDGVAYGICEPARRGHGETCQFTAECQDGLVCSNELGEFTGDHRHGTCKPVPLPQRADAGPQADAAPQDGGARDLVQQGDGAEADLSRD